MGSRRSDNPRFGDGASPGKIFIGGLAKDTELDTFVKYFAKYGEITDSVIIKDRATGRPRGFGFITYADPAVVDRVMEQVHVINEKEVEIKRTIPKGSGQATDFKTKKVFVGGIPTSVTEDELKDFFSTYGKVVEHEIIRDHATKRSRGFGFVIFENEKIVDDMLANGNGHMFNMAGTQVEVKKAEPKRASNPSYDSAAYGSEPRSRPYPEKFSGFNDYNDYGSGGEYGSAPYRSSGGFGGRFGDYGGFGASGADLGSDYGGFGGNSFSSFRGEQPPFGFSGRYGSYGGGYGGGSFSASYEQARGGGGYGNYGGSGSSGGYESGPSGSYGGPGGLYGGSRGGGGGGGGYGPSNRFHPYAR